MKEISSCHSDYISVNDSGVDTASEDQQDTVCRWATKSNIISTPVHYEHRRIQKSQSLQELTTSQSAGSGTVMTCVPEGVIQGPAAQTHYQMSSQNKHRLALSARDISVSSGNNPTLGTKCELNGQNRNAKAGHGQMHPKRRVRRMLPKVPETSKTQSKDDDKKKMLSSEVFSKEISQSKNNTIAKAKGNENMSQANTEHWVLQDNRMVYNTQVLSDSAANTANISNYNHNSPTNNPNVPLKRIITDLRESSIRPVYKTTSSTSSKLSSSESGDTEMQDFLETSRERSMLSSADTTSSPYSIENTAIRPLSNTQHMHPPLHKIIQHCTLHSVTIEQNGMVNFGLGFFESVFIDVSTVGGNSWSSFHTPEGKRPVLGRRPGAFLPVSSTSQSGGQHFLLVAVDYIKDGANLTGSDVVKEGDFLIEVNGQYVGACGVEEVLDRVTSCQTQLQLVVARYKSIHGNSQGDSGVVNQERENDKLRLKYESVKQDTECYLDLIADLKLQGKQMQSQLQSYEKRIRNQEKSLNDLQRDLKQKEEDVAQWQQESQDSHVEIARLRYEMLRKEEQNLDLQSLLVEQTGLVHLQDYNGAYVDIDYCGGERVSTV